MANDDSTVRPSTPAAAAPWRRVALDDDGRIADNVNCVACDYRLTGLDPDSTCPECAAPVAQSVRGDLLRFANLHWLERMRRGLTVLLVGYVSALAVAVASPLVAMAVMRSNSPARIMILVRLLVAARVLTTVITLLGAWWATAPEPGRAGKEGLFSARRVARVCFMATLITAALQLFNPFGTPFGTAPAGLAVRSAAAAFFMVAIRALEFVGIVGILAALVYLRQLARRIPRAALVGQSAVMAWGIGLTQAFGLALSVVVAIMMQTAAVPGQMSGNPITVVMSMGGCIVVGGALVFGIGALIVTRLFLSAVTRAANQSRATWVEP